MATRNQLFELTTRVRIIAAAAEALNCSWLDNHGNSLPGDPATATRKLAANLDAATALAHSLADGTPKTATP